MPTDAALPDESPAFVPDAAFLATVRHRVRRHRRRTRQRLGAGVALVAVIAGSGLWYTNDRLSSVQRIDLGTDPTASDPVADGTPFNLLVVGLDECETADDDMCANRLGLVPRDAPASADTIAVVHVDPAADTLDMLSVPRDLLADTNTKWSWLSVPQIRSHLRDDLGIEVDHAVTMTMTGFRDLAEDLTLRLSLGTAVRDRSSGLDLAAGCQRVDGAQLLALVRARHLEFRDGDGWRADQTGDIGRVARQQQVLRALFERLDDVDLGDARTLDRALSSIAVDDSLSNADVVRLARLARGSTLRSVAALPTHLGGDASMAFVSRRDAATVNPVIAPFGGHVEDTAASPTSTAPPGMQSILDEMESWTDISSC